MTSNLTHNKEILLADIGNIIFFQDVVVINQNFPISVLNITMFSIIVILVIFVNIMVLLRVKMKNRVLIDNMVTMDCLANILMVGLLLLAFPSRIWNNRFLCAGITIYRAYTVTINR